LSVIEACSEKPVELKPTNPKTYVELCVAEKSLQLEVEASQKLKHPFFGRKDYSKIKPLAQSEEERKAGEDFFRRYRETNGVPGEGGAHGGGGVTGGGGGDSPRAAGKKHRTEGSGTMGLGGWALNGGKNWVSTGRTAAPMRTPARWPSWRIQRPGRVMSPAAASLDSFGSIGTAPHGSPSVKLRSRDPAAAARFSVDEDVCCRNSPRR
jgi:hypothetical protein